MQRDEPRQTAGSGLLEPAVAAARLAARRRRRSEADLARAAQETLSAVRRQRRFERRPAPAEPMS